MKKILLLAVSLVVVSSCKSLRKNSDGSTGLDGGVKSETTASGGSERIDASPMNFSATGSDSGTINGLQTVFFDYDSAQLSNSEKAKLMGNIEWMRKNSSSKMTIEGHCDQRGSNEYNLSLGERRANAVKQIFISNGISQNRLSTVSFGEEKPLVSGDSEDAMSKNRRANFVPVN
jgi:peptidoglycan-associated lipoprotein